MKICVCEIVCAAFCDSDVRTNNLSRSLEVTTQTCAHRQTQIYLYCTDRWVKAWFACLKSLKSTPSVMFALHTWSDNIQVLYRMFCSTSERTCNKMFNLKTRRFGFEQRCHRWQQFSCHPDLALDVRVHFVPAPSLWLGTNQISSVNDKFNDKHTHDKDTWIQRRVPERWRRYTCTSRNRPPAGTRPTISHILWMWKEQKFCCTVNNQSFFAQRVFACTEMFCPWASKKPFLIQCHLYAVYPQAQC